MLPKEVCLYIANYVAPSDAYSFCTAFAIPFTNLDRFHLAWAHVHRNRVFPLLVDVCRQSLVVLAPQIVKQVDGIFEKLTLPEKMRPWSGVAAGLLEGTRIFGRQLCPEINSCYTAIQLQVAQMKTFRYSRFLGKVTLGDCTRQGTLSTKDLLTIRGLIPGGGTRNFAMTLLPARVKEKSDVEQFLEHDDPEALSFWIQRVLAPNVWSIVLGQQLMIQPLTTP